MYSVYRLKVLMRDRLTAVAEEILAEFEKITDGYEEEIDRQRELLDAFTALQTCKPQIKLHRIDFPEQHYFKKKEVLANQQHCNQKVSFSLYHEEPEPPQTEEDLEKLCTTQQAEQLPLKQEADTIMTPIYEESDHSESESMDEEFLSPDSPTAESQDQFGSRHMDSELRTKAKRNGLQSHCNNADDSPISSSQCKSDINFPQQLDLKEDEAFADEQLSNQEGCSSLEEPEPPCIKEDAEELCNSQQAEQLVLEADDIMVTQFDAESDHSESGSLSDDLLFPCPLTEILDELGSQRAHCGSINDSELKKKTEYYGLQSHCNNADDSPISSSQCKSDLNFPQQLDLKENETLTYEQPLNQEGCSSQDQKEPQPPYFEEDLEEFYNSQQAEQPKQEADAVMVTPIYEESDHSKPDSINEQVLPLTPPLARSQVQMENNVESGTLRNSDPKHVDIVACFQSPSSNVVHTPKSKPVQGPEKCDICGKMLKNRAQLSNHKKIHTSDRPHTCPICHKGFIFKCYMMYHMRTHKDMRLFHCTLCRKSFPSENALVDHMKDHTGQGQICCTICGKRFPSENALADHMNLHTDQGQISCTICGKSFTSEYALFGHMKWHTDERSFPCKTCGNSFTCRRALSDHMKDHRDKGPISCTICEKSFTSENRLAPHMKRHIDEEQFPCKVCGNRFASQRALTCHMKRHTDGRPHICEQCGKGFTQKFILLQHMMVHKKEKPFSCEVCGKSFKHRSSLIGHGKPYKDRKKRSMCPTCGKSFRSSCRLYAHMKNHKRYSCNVCGKRFGLKSPLYLHLDKKCKVPRQYSCEICGKSFHLESCLVVHVKTHEAKEKHSCEICGKSFKSYFALAVHSSRNVSKHYSCDKCGKSFQLELTLFRHVNKCHAEKRHLCEICGKAFEQPSGLSLHMITHAQYQPHSCDKCGRRFTRKKCYNRHLRLCCAAE